MRKIRPDSGIEVILKHNVSMLVIYFAIGAIVLVGSISYFLSIQSQNNACEVFKARFAQYEGPLGREKLLGDESVAREIFKELKQSMQNTAASENLVLIDDSTYGSSVPTCTNSFKGAKVYQPIIFAGRSLGNISGIISYFPFKTILTLLGFALFVMWIGYKLWTVKVSRQLYSKVIEPIVHLSKGNNLDAFADAAAEVQETSRNIEILKKDLKLEQESNFNNAKERELAKLARQVAHDIRSPLAVLGSLNNIKNSTDHKGLLDLATKRIQLITQVLLDKYNPAQSQTSFVSDILVSNLVKSILAEKQILYGAQIGFVLCVPDDIEQIFVKINATEFGRALSNIIDNAAQAINKAGAIIEIKAALVEKTFQLTVKDNGKGIPSSVLPTLAQEGQSYDKKNGMGLGLFHAKHLFESVGGSLTIESELDIFTTVKIVLPIVASPIWFSDTVDIPVGHSLVIIDDDNSVHELWKSKFKTLEICHFTDVNSEAEILLTRGGSNIFLIDQQINSFGLTGTEIIKKYGLGSRAYLVTSYHDDPDVQKAITEIGSRIIPKHLINFCSLQISSELTDPDAPDLVLIDDENLTKLTWEVAAQSRGVKIAGFNSVDSFLKAAIPLEVPVFVDFDLGIEINGREVTGYHIAENLWNLGYRQIHITTGFEEVDLPQRPSIIRSIGPKSFPDFIQPRTRKESPMQGSPL